MSDQGSAAVDGRLQDSHKIRARFEKVALISIPVILVLYCIIVLAGVIWRPVVAPAPDWGASIVQRAISVKDVLLDVVFALATVLGITATRGHFDARLDKQ